MADEARIDQLIEDSYSLVQFRNLPTQYQRAMVFYMAINGEAWHEPIADILDSEDLPRFDAGGDGSEWHTFWNQVVVDRMAGFIESYGDEYFGVLEVETGRFLDHLVQSPDIKADGETAEGYRQASMKYENNRYPDHPTTDRWPVILSGFEDETMQDGFHRLANYLRDGAETIPAIFYPEDRHFEAKAIPRPQIHNSPALGL